MFVCSWTHDFIQMNPLLLLRPVVSVSVRWHLTCLTTSMNRCAEVTAELRRFRSMLSESAAAATNLKVDPAETRTPVVRTLCKKYEAYIEIKVGIVIPVEFRIPLQLDLVSTDLPTL